MQTRDNFRFYHLLFITFFIFGIFIRFIGLGHLPLSDYEAEIANYSLILSNGSMPINSSGYPFLTTLISLLFKIFVDSNFWARFLPALFGSLFLVIPYIYRRKLGVQLALIITAWLSIDPFLIFLSRQVNGALATIFFLLLAIYFLSENYRILSGFFTALALITGPTLWWGLIPLGLAFLFTRVEFNFKEFIDRKFILSLGITTFLAVTGGYFWYFQTGNLAGGILKTLQFWFIPQGMTTTHFLGGIFFYELPVLFWGLIQMIRALQRGKKIDLLIAYVWGFSLIQFLLLPGRSVDLAIWFFLPLLFFAAKGIYEYFRRIVFRSRWLWIFGILQFVLLIFISLISFKSFNLSFQSNSDMLSRLLMVAGGVVLIGVSSYLIGWGWSLKLSSGSFLLALNALFLVMTISASWNLSGLRTPSHNELWTIGDRGIDSGLILNTIEGLMEGNRLDHQTVQIIFLGLDQPSVKWSFRKFSNAKYVSVVPTNFEADFILTPVDTEISLSSVYRGQDFVWNSKPAWERMTLNDWKAWYLTRRAPQELDSQEKIILWANNRLFPGYEEN